jgi:putative hydrolase
MKIWQKYQDHLFDGEWHIHTNFTDGANSIYEYAEKAVELGIPLLAFTEHVRKELTYDFSIFLDEINVARREFPSLILLSGCEAKVLPNGVLDCDHDIWEAVDYKIFAFHSFPQSLDKYINALEKVLLNYDVDAWAHPGLFLMKNNYIQLPNDRLINLFNLMEQNEILLELNIKHHMPRTDWLIKYLTQGVAKRVVFGGDIHKLGDLYLTMAKKQRWIDSFVFSTARSAGDMKAFIVWLIENHPESFRKL